jgi:lipopolysaccharide export system permease protein
VTADATNQNNGWLLRQHQSKAFSILDRYLIGELYKTFLAVAAILMLIILVNNFVNSLGDIVKGAYSSDVLLQLLGFQVIEMAGFLMPPSFFFAVLIALGKLYRDSEIIAMQAGGIGPLTIYRACLTGAVPIAALVALLVLFALPWSRYAQDQLFANRDVEKTDIRAVEIGKFQELQKGETVFFAEARGRNSGEIKNVFIQNIRNGKLGLITADEGYQYVDDKTANHYLVLKNGQRYVGVPGKNNFTISKFYEYAIRIRQVDEKKAGYSVKSKPTRLLLTSDKPQDRYELQFRLSIPLALLALACLAVPLSRSMPRQGIYGRLFLAFIAYFTFMNVHRLAHDWLRAGDVPSWMGMWWVPAVAVLVAILIELSDRYNSLFSHKRLRRLVTSR